MPKKYTLHYFNAKGAAEFIRYMFAFKDVHFKDKRYENETWIEAKPKMPFGQVPVLTIDNDVTLCQSKTIGRYIANELGLAGRNNLERAKADEFVDQMSDAHSEIAKMYFAKDDPEKVKEIFKDLTTKILDPKLRPLEDMLKTSKTDFIIGNDLTWADFYVASFISLWKIFNLGDFLQQYPNLLKVQETVEKLPEIKRWMRKRPVTEH
ncbi:hypothetical protein SNEBB_005386 [Seison nebaliae]|nr:hypothetical protein SNEBB_005386 [Seison nebaliae]